MKTIVLAMFMLVFSNAVTAQSKWDADQQDLVNCRWKATGEPIGTKLCNEFRAEVDRDRKYAEERRIRLESQREESARRTLKRQQEQRAISEETRQKWEAQRQAEQEASKRETEEYERRDRAARKLADAREQAIKDKCGADYRQAKIGMSITRAQECVGKFRMTNQINRADGIVSTYQTAGMYINVMDDRIIAWGKY